MYRNTVIVPVTKPLVDRILLGVTHLANLVGISMAAYGNSPKASKPHGVKDVSIAKIGNCVMLVVMLMLLLWTLYAGKCIRNARSHQNYKKAKILFFTACAGLPFQTIRLTYSTTYAFSRISSLDPFMGSFATKVVLIFCMQLAVALACCCGGFLSTLAVKRKLPQRTGSVA